MLFIYLLACLLDFLKQFFFSFLLWMGDGEVGFHCQFLVLIYLKSYVQMQILNGDLFDKNTWSSRVSMSVYIYSHGNAFDSLVNYGCKLLYYVVSEIIIFLQNETPLHLAIRYGHHTCAESLIHSGASLQIKDCIVIYQFECHCICICWQK